MALVTRIRPGKNEAPDPASRTTSDRSRRVLAALFALLAFAAGFAGPLSAQCTLVSGPVSLSCPECSADLRQSFFQNGWLGLYNSGGNDRLMVPMSWGYIVYSLGNPAYPTEIAVDDLRYDSTGPGRVSGDGQNYVASYGVGADGQRALLSLQLPGQGTGGSGGGGDTVVETASGNKFMATGDTGFKRAGGGLVVQKNGTRYIGYGLDSSGSLFVADITNPPGYSTINKMPSENPALFATRSAGSLGLAEGGGGTQFLYALDGSNALVVNVSNPGPVGSISSGFHGVQIPPSAFGLPGYTLLGVSGAVDPTTGKLYLLGSFWSGARVPYFGLVLFDPGTEGTTFVGTFSSPDSSFSGAAGTKAGALAVNPYTNDVEAFMWVSSPTQNLRRLYATSAKKFGSSIGQWADVSGMQGNLAGTTILFKSQTDTYAYFWDSLLPYAVRLNCQAAATPATGVLTVSNVSTGSPVSIASGATVFVGDTLQVSPSVSPSNATQPVTAWNLDLDYHPSAETGAVGLTQLVYPDACLSGCSNPFPGNPDPPMFTFVGPCDPRAGGNPETGTACWTSVKDTDFAATPPVSSWIAFEAENSLNVTTVPLAQFKLVWQVPTAGLQGLSALLNGTSATFQADTSQLGHPTTYRWYFGSSSTAPSGETLSLDPGCTGPSCTHSFPAGKGSYNAWLTTLYRNGYSTPDCGTPCVAPAGTPIVSVTDFVASFTAASTVQAGGSLGVTNGSQIGGGVTGVSYLYTFCDATAGPCADPGSYQTIPGMGGPGTQGTIPAPATAGTWWLRIRATYNAGSVAQWLPGAVTGSPDAFPLSVTPVPTSIVPTSGTLICSVGGCQTTYYGSACTAISLALYQGSTQMTQSATWSVSGGSPNPASGTGSTFTFTPQSGGTMVTVSASGVTPVPSPVSIYVQGSCPPPVSVTVSPSSYGPTAGTAITLTASPSGGTGTYTTYDWNFGDTTSTSGSSPSVSHSYAAAGSFTVTCTVHDSGGATGGGNTTVNVVAPPPPVKGDFNGDRKTDIVWRNTTTGQNALWLMNGTSLLSITDLPALPNTNYLIAGVGDFNGDGSPDIVWRNTVTGQNAVWLMGGTGLSSIVDLPALPSTSYVIGGIGDFNGDGSPDIVWRNTTTGQNAVWLMNGTSLSSLVDFPALPNTNYVICGLGDFNADGKTDVVWRNMSTGQNALWLMNGTSLSSVTDLPALPNASYTIGAIGDFNGDGNPDIVWRNTSTGQNALWLMNGTSLSSIADLPALPNGNYKMAGPR